MSRDDEALDELELALEALATGRDDLVPADLRAHIEGDPALRDELARDRALHIDLGLALRDAPTPEVDLDAMVAAAMDAAPPVPSRRGLWLATGIGTLSTLGLGLAALGGLPTPSRVQAWGATALTALAASHRLLGDLPGGYAGVGLALFAAVLLLGWPLRALTRASAPVALALATILGTSALGHAQRFEGEWPETERVTLDAEGEPAAAVLRRACETAGLGYVSRMALEAPVTVHVQEAPLRQLLAAVLPSDAVARRDGSLVIVQAAEPAAEPERPAEPAAAAGAPPPLASAASGEASPSPAIAPPVSPPAISPPAIPPMPPASAIGAERVTMGQSVRVGPDEIVAEVVTMGGDATIEGQVVGDVVTMGGDVTVTGLVRGDVVSMGGDITVEGDGRVLGELGSMGGDIERHGAPQAQLAIDLHDDDDDESVAAAVLGSAARHGLIFLLGVLLLGAFPRRHAAMARSLAAGPVRALLAGFLGFLATVLLFIASAITLIGIPVAIFLALAAAVACCAGLAVVASVVGAAIPWPRSQGRPLLQLGLGVLALWLVSLVPFLGGVLLLVLGCAGYGAVLLTRFGRPRDA